jgi:hypothetical protein
LGYKDKAVDVLLVLAEDEKQEGGLRRSCAQAVGKLGFKDKAIKILIEFYLAHTDKYEYESQRIYDALWDLTAV